MFRWRQVLLAPVSFSLLINDLLVIVLAFSIYLPGRWPLSLSPAPPAANMPGIADEAGPAFALREDNPGISGPVSAASTKKPVTVRKVVRSVPEAKGRIALTFDDGPFPYWTEVYQRVLNSYQVPATFFVTGAQASAYPQLVAQIAGKDNEVGSHSNSHSHMAQLSSEKIFEDLSAASSHLTKALGKPVSLFRPPYGHYDPRVVEAAQTLGWRTVTWSVDPRDWEEPEFKQMARSIVNRAVDGDIILLHERRQGTLYALGFIISGLHERGFQLTTVSDLLSAELIPGENQPANPTGKSLVPDHLLGITHTAD